MAVVTDERRLVESAPSEMGVYTNARRRRSVALFVLLGLASMANTCSSPCIEMHNPSAHRTFLRVWVGPSGGQNPGQFDPSSIAYGVNVRVVTEEGLELPGTWYRDYSETGFIKVWVYGDLRDLTQAEPFRVEMGNPVYPILDINGNPIPEKTYVVGWPEKFFVESMNDDYVRFTQVPDLSTLIPGDNVIATAGGEPVEIDAITPGPTPWDVFIDVECPPGFYQSIEVEFGGGSTPILSEEGEELEPNPHQGFLFYSIFCGVS